jgi:haloalkane dehalogenase
MNRRGFLEMTAGMFAAATLDGSSAGAMGSSAASKSAASRHPGPTSPTDVARFRAERRFARTSAGQVAYVERGSGGAALFLHGFPLNGFQWRGALDRLAGERRCLAPDFLGLGYTQVARGASVAPVAQVAMLVELLDLLKIDTVDLVANDSGGAVAQLLAVTHPRRVRTMLLTNCDVEPDSPPPALQPVLELSRAGLFAERWLAPWIVDKALARSLEGLGGQTYTHPDHPTDEAIDYYLEPLVRGPELTHAYALALDPNPLAGIEAKLRASKIPTRILWGTGDTIFSKESPGYLDRVLGNSRGVRRIEGAKLFWPEEFPDVVAEEARRLWAEA